MCRGIEMWANHIKVFTVIQTVTEELNHQNVNYEVLNKFNRQTYEQHIIQMCINYQQFGEWSVVIGKDIRFHNRYTFMGQSIHLFLAAIINPKPISKSRNSLVVY